MATWPWVCGLLAAPDQGEGALLAALQAVGALAVRSEQDLVHILGLIQPPAHRRRRQAAEGCQGGPALGGPAGGSR